MNMEIVSRALRALLKGDQQAAPACLRLRREVLASPRLPGTEKSLILLMLSVAHAAAPSQRHDVLAWLALRLTATGALTEGAGGANQGCRVTDSTITLLSGLSSSSTWTLAMASTTSMPAMTWPNTA